jgi:hypothetical protein
LRQQHGARQRVAVELQCRACGPWRGAHAGIGEIRSEQVQTRGSDIDAAQ